MTDIYERIRTVFSQTSDERKDFEISDFLPWFRKNLAIFHNLDTGTVALGVSCRSNEILQCFID